MIFSRQLDRRQVLAGVAGAAGMSVLAGCSSSNKSVSGGQEELQVWDLFSGADGQRMHAMLQKVLSKNPGIRLKPVTLAWGSPYYTKLAMASAGRRPPDAAVMHVSRLSGYAPGGLLDPWDLDLLEEFGVHQSDFSPALWSRCTYQGKLYALPLDTHPVLAFYNSDIAEKAGMLDPQTKRIKPPENADQMLALSAKLSEVTKSTGIAYGYLLDAAQSWRLFWGLYRQTGGAYKFVPGSKAEMDEGKAAEVLDFIKELLNGKGGTNDYDYAGAIAAFNGGHAGMILSGDWELNGFQQSVKNLAAMPMPNLFGKPASYADSHSYVLPRAFHQPSDHRKRMVYALVTGILKEAITWAQAGHIPAFGPVRESAAYRALKPQSSYASAIDTVVIDPPAWFAGAGSDFENQMCQAMQGTFQGQQSSRTAVQKMLSAASSLSAKPNPA